MQLESILYLNVYDFCLFCKVDRLGSFFDCRGKNVVTCLPLPNNVRSDHQITV
jgi:hypothetical protein